MATQHTKGRILGAAEELIWKKNFQSAGFNGIHRDFEVPKGSFYRYLGSEEHFNIELPRHCITDATVVNRETLANGDFESDPIERLLGFLGSSRSSPRRRCRHSRSARFIFLSPESF